MRSETGICPAQNYFKLLSITKYILLVTVENSAVLEIYMLCLCVCVCVCVWTQLWSNSVAGRTCDQQIVLLDQFSLSYWRKCFTCWFCSFCVGGVWLV